MDAVRSHAVKHYAGVSMKIITDDP